jgi:hypothetical protein
MAQVLRYAGRTITVRNGEGYVHLDFDSLTAMLKTEGYGGRKGRPIEIPFMDAIGHAFMMLGDERYCRVIDEMLGEESVRRSYNCGSRIFYIEINVALQ